MKAMGIIISLIVYIAICSWFIIEAIKYLADDD